MNLRLLRRGQGRPVILLHGLFGNANNWAPLTTELEGDFDVITPDLRNHGRSPHAEASSLDDMADDILGMIQSLRLEKIFLLGHSLGGRIAMRLCLDHPEAVERLVVADMAPRAYPPLFPEVFAAMEALDLKSLGNRSEADLQLQKYLPDTQLRAFVLSNLSADPSGTFLWRTNLPALKAARASWSRELEFSTPFPSPALFLRGETSEYVRESDRHEILRSFPAARIETIADAGHWLHVDQPSVFASAVRGFFGSL